MLCKIRSAKWGIFAVFFNFTFFATRLTHNLHRSRISAYLLTRDAQHSIYWFGQNGVTTMKKLVLNLEIQHLSHIMFYFKITKWYVNSHCLEAMVWHIWTSKSMQNSQKLHAESVKPCAEFPKFLRRIPWALVIQTYLFDWGQACSWLGATKILGGNSHC